MGRFSKESRPIIIDSRNWEIAYRDMLLNSLGVIPVTFWKLR